MRGERWMECLKLLHLAIEAYRECHGNNIPEENEVEEVLFHVCKERCWRCLKAIEEKKKMENIKISISDLCEVAKKS